MGKGQSFQEMVLGQLVTHTQKEAGHLPHTPHKNLLKMNLRPRCLS